MLDQKVYDNYAITAARALIMYFDPNNTMAWSHSQAPLPIASDESWRMEPENETINCKGHRQSPLIGKIIYQRIHINIPTGIHTHRQTDRLAPPTSQSPLSPPKQPACPPMRRLRATPRARLLLLFRWPRKVEGSGEQPCMYMYVRHSCNDTQCSNQAQGSSTKQCRRFGKYTIQCE